MPYLLSCVYFSRDLRLKDPFKKAWQGHKPQVKDGEVGLLPSTFYHMCLLTEYILRNLFLDGTLVYLHDVCYQPIFYKVGQKVNYDATSEFK